MQVEDYSDPTNTVRVIDHLRRDLAALGFTHSQFAASGQPAFDRRVAQALL
jgi:hypothetical protein